MEERKQIRSDRFYHCRTRNRSWKIALNDFRIIQECWEGGETWGDVTSRCREHHFNLPAWREKDHVTTADRSVSTAHTQQRLWSRPRPNRISHFLSWDPRWAIKTTCAERRDFIARPWARMRGVIHRRWGTWLGPPPIFAMWEVVGRPMSSELPWNEAGRVGGGQTVGGWKCRGTVHSSDLKQGRGSKVKR